MALLGCVPRLSSTCLAPGEESPGYSWSAVRGLRVYVAGSVGLPLILLVNVTESSPSLGQRGAASFRNSACVPF